MKRILTVVLSSLLLSACNIMGVVCTTEARPAIRVSVVNAVDGAAIAAPGIVIATDGAFADTVRVVTGAWPMSVGLAHERSGTYTVEVLIEGFASWSEQGVRVSSDECHVRTAELTAELTPAP